MWYDGFVMPKIKTLRKPQYRVSQREYENRGRLADKIMSWANLVFGGLVLTQAFSNQFDRTTAIKAVLAGIALFFSAYFVTYRIMKGGEQ